MHAINMSLVNRKFNFGEIVCDLWIIEIEKDKFMYGGHAIAEFLGYKQPAHAIKNHVKSTWKTIWQEINGCIKHTPVQLPPNWQPNTVFISEAGVYALIMRSKLPAAEEFQRWLFEEVLPELRKTGKYSIQQASCNTTKVVNYDKKLADAQMESMQLKLELSQTVAKYDKRVAELNQNISEIKRNYEKQIAELKERECHMQLAMSNLSAAANMTMTQFAVNALLARDNIEENTQMRQTLADISGRVVPDMASQPEKEEYITGYERMVNGRRRIRMCRSQLNEIDQQDREIHKFREEAATAQQPDRKRTKFSKRYAWLRDSEKFLQLKCPNPVAVWLKVRAERPHLFYGLRYTNKLRTEMEVLEERELREKYRRDADMCERNRPIHSRLIEEFKALELVDENDCVARCLTPGSEAKERINAIVEGIVANMSKELVPAAAQRKHDNAGDVYTAEQVVHAMHNCTNYFVKSINFNFYTGAAPPPPPPPLPIESPNV
ncbi:bro-b [Cyclophragma undans nucleopolyhedrovirus]|uniref:Bro-b n=1 Tax=Cyclophragma undans nucleopolyhedrovirus TaxID=1906244 RepID=A0A288Q7G7_9ABAC|nr:bro-b [Cyclophragma undans nucleopolyhedrovirus]AOT85500.1 bro-b [Cyclophragma undans nucleopolyhedrovirus]